MPEKKLSSRKSDNQKEVRITNEDIAAAEQKAMAQRSGKSSEAISEATSAPQGEAAQLPEYDKHGKKLTKAERENRTRHTNWSGVFYPESCPPNWEDVISNEHVRAFVSPLHCDDRNPKFGVEPDATEFKKPHYHFIVMYPSTRQFETQVKPLFDKLCAPTHEWVKDLGASARYLCHLDNPEKAQYPVDQVRAFGGANYKLTIQSKTDLEAADAAAFAMVNTIIRKMMPYDFNSLCNFCEVYCPDCLDLLEHKATYYFAERIKSMNYALADEGIKRVWYILDGVLRAFYGGDFEVRPWWETDGDPNNCDDIFRAHYNSSPAAKSDAEKAAKATAERTDDKSATDTRNDGTEPDKS